MAKIKPSKVIGQSVESYKKHRVECAICGQVDTIDDSDWSPTHREATTNFVERGWRLVASDEYNLIGLACPTCVANEAYLGE